jgi:hypothetical protein
VELVQINAVEPETAQAPFTRRSQMLGAAILGPLIRPRTLQACFGGDDQVCRIRIQVLGNQGFSDSVTVGVSGVNEIDSQLDNSTKYANGFVAILRLTPDPFASQPHRSES